jgi:hypothetical protein
MPDHFHKEISKHRVLGKSVDPEGLFGAAGNSGEEILGRCGLS